jgi:hypothetical protein
MSEIGWADVAVTDAGAFVMCASRLRAAAVLFGNTSVPIPEPGRDLRVCWAAGHAYGIIKGQDTGWAIVARDDGLVARLGMTYGNSCVGVMPTATGLLAVYVTSTTRYIEFPLGFDLTKATPSSLPIPPEIVGTSQGFLDLMPGGEPVWTDLQRTATLPNGLTLALWMRRGGWIIGQGPAAPAQVAAWDGAQMHTVWQGDTPFPPRLAVSAGGAVMAGMSTAVPVFVAGPFGPYVTAPAGVSLPALPALTHKVSIAVYKDLLGISGTDSEVLVNFQAQANVRPCWSAEECLPFKKGPLYGLYTEAKSGEDGMFVLPRAKALQTRILWVWDDEGEPQLSSKLRDYDVPAIECYLPNAKGSETLEQSIARWEHNLDYTLRHWSFDLALVLMYYTKGGIGSAELYSVQDVVNAIGAAVPLLDRSPRLKLALTFEFDRADGISAHPDIREMLRRLVIATPGVPTFRPVTPIPPRKPMPTVCALTAIADFNSDALTEVPHQDGPPNIALQKPGPNGTTLTANLGTGATVIAFKVVGTPGADERFIDAGNCYVAIRGGGARAFAKTGPWK